MQFRKSILKNKSNVEREIYPIFEHISDIAKLTCVNKMKTKNKCGVNNIQRLPEELNTSEDSVNVKWEWYEYINIPWKGGKMCRKLQFVTKGTNTGIIFQHILKLLTDCPARQHRANWQNSQFKTLIDNLPIDHAVCVHDFSESYRCSDQREIQSSYFQKTKVNIHVTIVYRHSML